MDIRRKKTTKYIVLREAARMFGYAADYIGFLIRKGKIEGKRIYTNVSWQITPKVIIKYCREMKNLEIRDSFLLKKEYLSLKEAAKISGYAPDYIGFLIRQKKLPGKKSYSGVTWMTTEESVRRYQTKIRSQKLKIKTINKLGVTYDIISQKKIKNLAELITDFKPQKTLRAKFFNFSLRFATLILIILFLNGIGPLELFQKLVGVFAEEEWTVELYPSLCNGEWRSPQNAQDQPEVVFDGDFDSFSEANSAVYKGGSLNLICQDFKTISDQPKIEEVPENEQTAEEQVTEEEIITETEEPAKEQLLEEKKEEETQLTDETNPDEINLEEQAENKPTSEELIEEVQVSEEISPEENSNGGKNILEEPTKTPEVPSPETNKVINEPENKTEEPLSFFQKVKKFFGFQTTSAEQIPTLAELENTQFKSAKIKFSFAIGEKKPDLEINQNPAGGSTENGSLPETLPNPEPQLPPVETPPVETPPVETPPVETPPVETPPVETPPAENPPLEIAPPVTGILKKIKNFFGIVTAQAQEKILPIETTNAPTEGISMPNLDTKIIILYSLDSETWKQLETISSYPLSNASNGDYFSFDAPFLKNWDDVKNLRIKFEGMIGGETVYISYLDSVWVEAKYKKTQGEFELTAFKKYWRADEEPEFEITPINENIVDKIVAKIGYKVEEEPKVEAILVGPDGHEIPLETGKDFSSQTASPTRIKIFKSSEFRPGLYKLRITYGRNNKTYTFEKDFAWGVLAINTNKSIYLPDDEAYLQMAVLDFEGHTICDANLKLEIQNPKSEMTTLSTEDGTIQYNNKCSRNNVIDVPDYFSYYQVKEIGQYKMRLTNLDNGYEMEDYFEVRESVLFDVERIGPTRIWPMATYEMKFKIKANQNFEGQIIEQVPVSFEIITNPLLKLNENNDLFINALLGGSENEFTISENWWENSKEKKKPISWQVLFETGKTYEFNYEFDAPDISPYLYLVGPLEFSESNQPPEQFSLALPAFKESRQWQIAADATTYTQTCPSPPACTCKSALEYCATNSACAVCGSITCPAAYANSVFSSNGCFYNKSGCFCDTGAKECNGGTCTCTFSSGSCNYTCNGGRQDCNGGTDGCECSTSAPSDCCSGTTRYYSCNGNCNGTSCPSCGSANCSSEDCATKTSYDSDSGDVPGTGGYVYDYASCSSGTCPVAATYADTCSGTNSNGLTEYYINGSSYSSHVYASSTSSYCFNTTYDYLIDCAAGTANCDQTPGNACEINTTNDNNNCGTCGNVCGGGYTCISSVCTSTGITVSGNVYSDEASTVWPHCDSVTPTYNISLAVNGVVTHTASCNSSTGAYSIPSVTVAAGQEVAVFMNATDKGIAVTVAKDASTTPITLNPREGRVWVKEETSAPSNITNTLLHKSDKAVTGCTNVPYTIDDVTNALTVDATYKIVIETGKIFAPDGAVTTPAMEVTGTYTAGSYTLILSSAGSGVTCTADAGTMMPLCVTGTFTASTDTVQYSATTGGLTVAAVTYNNLTLSNTSGTDTAGGAIAVGGTFTTTADGTLNMATYALTATTVSNAGILQTQNTSAAPIPTGKTWGGTVQYNATTGAQTVMAGTYGILTLSNTSGTDTASGAITATTLNTTASGILNMVTYDLAVTNVTNNGTIRTQSVSATPLTTGKTWAGTVQYDSTVAGQTVVVATYNNLTFNNTGQTATLAGAIVVSGNLLITTGALDTKSGSNYAISVAGNWTNSIGAAGFVAQAGTVTFNGSGTQTINSGGSSFYHVILSNNTFTLLTNAMTVGGNLVISEGKTPTITATTSEAFTVTGATDGTATTGAETLTVNTTGAVTFTGAVGTGQALMLTALTITNSAALLFSSTVNITGNLVQTNAATGLTTFTGTVAAASATLRGTTYSVLNSFTSTGAVAVTNSGIFTKGATGAIVAPGGFTTSGAVTLSNNITTTNTALSIGGTLVIGEGATPTLAAGSGAITVVGATDGTATTGAETLTVNTTGAVTFTGAVGTGQALMLTTLTVTNSAALLFSSTINITGALTQTNAATGLTTFTGTVAAASATLRGTTYSVLNSFTTTGAVAITNSGLLTKNSTGAIVAPGGFSTATTGNVNLSSNITTTNTTLSIGGTLVIGEGATPTLAAGSGAITVVGATDGTATTGAETLTVNTTGAVTFTGAVGTGQALMLTTLTVTNSAALLFSSTINITGALTQTNAATGTTTFSSTVAVGSATLNGVAINLGGTTTVSGNLTLTAGTLQLSTYDFSVGGTSSITGTLSDNSATGTNLFVGAVTVNNGGTWTTTNNPAFEFRGGLTVNSTSTFTQGTGIYTFSTNAQTISGTQAFTITNLTNNVTTSTGLTFTTNNPTVTTLTQGSNAQLTFSGTVPTITTLTATASGNTVSYTKADGGQTVIGAAYFNLTLSNTSGTETAGGDITVSNVLTTTASGIFDASSRTITLSGNTGTPFVNGGTFTHSTSTVQYTGANAGGNTNVVAVDYWNLILNAVDTFDAAGNIEVSNVFTIQHASAVFDAKATTLTLSGSGTPFVKTGTFTASTSTVKYTTSSGAWLSGWDKRIKITTDQTDIDADLTNFPVLVYLSTSSGRNSDDVSAVFDELTSDANRKKIAVTKSDGTTELYVEIEKWDDANEKAWLWVSKSDWVVSGTTDTDFYLYYDVDHADNTTYVADSGSRTEVWDTNYMAVWHLVETTGNYLDSTGNNNDIDTISNLTGRSGAAKIGGTCPDFNGTTSYLSAPYSATLDSANLAIEEWVYTHSQTQEQNVISKNANAHPNGWNHELYQSPTPNHLHFQNGEASADMCMSNTDVPGSTWMHGAITYASSGTTTTFYKDGASDGSCATISAWVNQSVPVYIGSAKPAASLLYPYDGLLDEIRLSSSVRLAAWIKAGYETGRDDLLDFGTEETQVLTYITAATYNNLELKPSASNIIFVLGTAGSQTINTNGYLTIGDGTHTNTIIADTYDPTLNVDGDFTIAANATFIASNSGTFTIAGNFSNSGTFTHSSGTVTFDGGGGTTQEISGSTTFNNFTATATAARNLKFASSSTQTVAGTWTITGAAGQLITLTTITGTTQWTINPTAASVSYVDVNYSNNTGVAFCASYSISTNDTNTNWNVSAGATCGITVSGNAFDDEASDVWGNGTTGCDGSTARISLVVNGGTASTTHCHSADGSYSFTGVTVAANNPVSVFFNTTGSNTEKGVAVTVAADSSSNITLNPRKNIVWVKTEGAVANIINTNLDHCDSVSPADCANVLYSVTTGALTVADGAELHIESGKTFAPGGTVTTSVSSTPADRDGDIHVAGTFSVGTNAVSVGGDWNNTGTFSKSTGQTTTFTATGTGFSITPGTGNFDSVTFNGSGGGWSFAATTTIDVDLTMTAGTLSGTSSVNVNGGDVTGNGTITLTGGTFLLDTAGNFGGDTSWTFFNLTFGDGSGATTTTKTGIGAVTVSNVLTIALAQVLDAGDDTWTLSGTTGTPFVITGTFTGSTSTFIYSGVYGSGNTTIAASLNYCNLQINGSETYTLGGNTTLSGDFTATLGTLSEDTDSLTVNGGDITGNGTITFTGGTVLLDTAGNFGGDTAWTFFNLTFGDGSGATTTTKTGIGAVTVSNVLTIALAQVLDAGDDTWTLSGTGTPFVITGTFTYNTSTVVYSGATTATNVTSTTYYNLNLGGSDTTTIYTAADNITVYNVLTIVSSSGTNTFDASSRTITLSGTGTPFVISASEVFTPSTSTVKYTGDGATNITATTYNNLEFSPTITDNRIYTGAGAITVGGTLNINPSATAKSLTFILGGTTSVTGVTTIQRTSTATSILDTKSGSDYTFNTGSLSIQAGGTLTGRASALDSNGDVTIAASGTLTSTSGNFNVGGSWSNSATGVFTHSSGTVTFDATTTGKTISDGGDPFYNILFNGSGGGWTYTDGCSTAPNQTTVQNGTANYINTKTGTVSVTGGELVVDWYLGVHVADAVTPATHIDTGVADITISENSGTPASTVWRYNGGWGSGATSQTTGTDSNGNNPQPTSTGAILIREYSKTSGATTYYLYNLQITWQSTYGEYNYYSDYGSNYLTSTANSGANKDAVIGVDWYRATIGTMNAVGTINEPPTSGSWYCGMLNGLSFSIDSFSVTFGTITPGAAPADITNTLTVTTSATNGYVITAWSSQEMACSNAGLCGIATISDWTGTNISPSTWSSGFYGFGYSTDDTTLSGGTANRFSGPKFAGFSHSGSGDPIADRSSSECPCSSQQNIITYRIAADVIQRAGPYGTTIIYVITAQY